MFAAKCPALHVPSFTYNKKSIQRKVRCYYSVKLLDDEAIVKDDIVAFTNFEDAFRYKTLLEAEMDHKPYVQFASRFELEHTCNVGGYRCRVVNEGALVTPPNQTLKITDWERRSALLKGRWSVKDTKEDPPFEWP